MAKYKTLNKKEKRQKIAREILAEVIYPGEDFGKIQKTEKCYQKEDRIINIIKKYV